MQLGYEGLEVSSSLWVQAVTDAEITQGIVWGIVLSSLFAFVSMFVFTGAFSTPALQPPPSSARNVVLCSVILL